MHRTSAALNEEGGFVAARPEVVSPGSEETEAAWTWGRIGSIRQQAACEEEPKIGHDARHTRGSTSTALSLSPGLQQTGSKQWRIPMPWCRLCR